MSTSPLDKPGLLRTALSACKTLSAGVLCNRLSTFLTAISTIGWDRAVAALDPATAAVTLVVATIFGVTKGWESADDRKKAGNLASEIQKLSIRQGTALTLLEDIANGKTGVTLDWITQQELAETIVTALYKAGLATSEQVNEVLKGVKNIDERLDDISKLLHDRLAQVPSERALAPDNFAEAGIVPNADFVGREEILERLHQGLQEGDVALTHDLPGVDAAAQALRGEGGIGKTQIAIQYAHQHAHGYEGRWWLDASKEAIDISAARLAATLGAEPRPTDTPELICAAIRRILSEGKRRHLLILDNLEEPDRLKGFLLPGPSRVLVTTRLRRLPPAFVNEVPITVFEPHESLALLRKHRLDLAGAEYEDTLTRVADHLGHHALAVTLAAAYLRKRASVSPADVLERLRRAPLGDKEYPLEKVDPNEHTAGYRLSVAQSLSLHLPDFRDTPAMDVLAVAALCHPDDIPVELFVGVCDHSQEACEDWLVKLADVSMIRYEGKTVSVHRLMQEVVRVEIGQEKQRKSLTALVAHLAERFKDPKDHRNWADQEPYAAHAEAAVEHAERLGELPNVAFLGNQVGAYLWARGRLDRALVALRIARAALGDDCPEVAICANNIGMALKAKGDLDAALKCYREAEHITRAASGEDHPEVAICINNIGSVLKAKGDLDGALKCFREAERIARAALRDDCSEVAIYVNNIAEVLRNKGDLDGALKCYREAERIARAALGDDCPEVAICVNNIGMVLQAKDDLDGALECYREAERIGRATFGDYHPAVALRLNNIATVLLAKGDLVSGRKMMCEAFRIFLTTIGPRALQTVGVANNLTILHLDPVEMAREIAGDAVAEELRQALA